jgi:hypothetical protein
MTLPIKLSYRPMEAEPASELPKGRNGNTNRNGMDFAV